VAIYMQGKPIESMKYSYVFRIRTSLIPLLLWTMAAFGAESKQNAEKAREIEDNLIAPCCWSQPVSQHYSEVAEQIRNEVSAMVAAGKGRDEILDYFVSKYGERILATPRPKGFNTTVYILPWAALVVGAGLLFVLLKKLRAPVPSSAPAPEPENLYASKVEKELKDLDE
jgi:cytochrome c-type biogenesis protein CcmH